MNSYEFGHPGIIEQQTEENQGDRDGLRTEVNDGRVDACNQPASRQHGFIFEFQCQSGSNVLQCMRREGRTKAKANNSDGDDDEPVDCKRDGPLPLAPVAAAQELYVENAIHIY